MKPLASKGSYDTNTDTHKTVDYSNSQFSPQETNGSMNAKSKRYDVFPYALPNLKYQSINYSTCVSELPLLSPFLTNVLVITFNHFSINYPNCGTDEFAGAGIVSLSITSKLAFASCKKYKCNSFLAIAQFISKSIAVQSVAISRSVHFFLQMWLM